MKKRVLFLFAIGLGNLSISLAQTYNLQQCIEYAIKNHESAKTSELEQKMAKAKVGEIRSIGLPQISASAQFMDNIEVQKMFAPADALSGGSEPLLQLMAANGLVGANEAIQGMRASSGQIVALGFGVKYGSNIGVSVSQLIFDGSYLIGLKAAKTYSELAVKSTENNTTLLAENVSKAYYFAVINEERKKIFDNNIERLDSTMKQAKALQKSGFVEKIDVDRLTVNYNNLLVEKQKFDNMYKLSLSLLKFQMGLPQTDSLVVADKIADLKFSTISSTSVDYSSRTEHRLLGIQRKLYELDYKANRAGYLPNLVAFGNAGYTSGSKTIDIWNGQWKHFTNIGLMLNVPIFDGMKKHYKMQQSKINIDKTDVSKSQLERGIDLQVKQAQLNLDNAIKSMDIQKQNIELAQEVVRVGKIKYQQGVGSSLEITNSESDLRTAQINYYAALSDVLIAKVDLEKALGTLVK